MKEYTVLVGIVDKQVYRVKAGDKGKAIKKAILLWYQKIAHPEIVDIFTVSEAKMEEEKTEAPVEEKKEEETTEEAPKEEEKAAEEKKEGD